MSKDGHGGHTATDIQRLSSGVGAHDIEYREIRAMEDSEQACSRWPLLNAALHAAAAARRGPLGKPSGEERR